MYYMKTIQLHLSTKNGYFLIFVFPLHLEKNLECKNNNKAFQEIHGTSFQVEITKVVIPKRKLQVMGKDYIAGA